MKEEESKIISELKNIIKESCQFAVSPPEIYQKFHRTLLKYSFGALNVEVDYEHRSILVYNSKPTNPKSMDLMDYTEGFFEKVDYTDLEETLLGCLSEGIFNERFYTHLLYDMGRISDNNEFKTA